MTATERVRADGVPEPPSNLWSNCLKHGELVFMSGLTAAGPDGTVVGAGTLEQSREIMRKISELMVRCGGTLDDVVKLVIYLTDIGTKADFGAVRREVFTTENLPCSTLVEVSSLVDPRLVIEVEATGIVPTRS